MGRSFPSINIYQRDKIPYGWTQSGGCESVQLILLPTGLFTDWLAPEKAGNISAAQRLAFTDMRFPGLQMVICSHLGSR